MSKFDDSYLSLPNFFYQKNTPNIFSKSKIFILNKLLLKDVDPFITELDLKKILLENKKKKKCFSQAYSGHQFGHFTNLGDGRAMIIGEHLLKNNQRVDLQLKGCGITKYSRGGDGKATLRSMLKEYIISEAIHYLKIPSSRSLAVFKTGEKINRENLNDGAVLARIMHSHIRVGTFEYAAFFGNIKYLNSLTNYTVKRLYPNIQISKNIALSLLETVMNKQIDLVINWMRVGFIHGVMNTDNTSISAETFDYGPCAFINNYNPNTSYSSIDYYKRYSFGNQTKVIKWNISRFAETLLPLINKNQKTAIVLAQNIIDKFDEIWNKKFYEMMLQKIGVKKVNQKSYKLVDNLLKIMLENKLDYTNTFYNLTYSDIKINTSPKSKFDMWKNDWQKFIEDFCNKKEIKKIMKNNNPIIIPRNQIVEQAIEEAVKGNKTMFNKLNTYLTRPYEYQNDIERFILPPSKEFENCYKTYCGT